MKQSKDEKILWEYYRRAYKAATPSADFDKLVEEAPIVDGEKKINFDAYVLESEKQEEIIDEVCKEFKIPKNRRYGFGFEFEFRFGSGPKIKYKENVESNN
jgi:hypothetical protein